jgi:hypothetical protein
MTHTIVASGTVVLHECDTWSGAIDWLDRYLRDGDGGHDLFQIKAEGEVRATYLIDRTEEFDDEQE